MVTAWFLEQQKSPTFLTIVSELRSMLRFRSLLIGALFASLFLSAKVLSGNDLPAANAKKVVFVAGTRSHGYGSHEHNAGCQLLARSLQQAMPDYEVVVNLNGWPKEESFFKGADTIVMYADGGKRHPVIPHLAQADSLAKQGVGIVCIHYGVEVPKGEAGDKFVDWIGGYFETEWSVNPHWTAEFKKFPDHPVSQGVKPFAINDEWYYHMRFRKDMQGVTPILTAIPPASTLSRPDGPHSGNPHVRKTVGQPQHVGWVSERPGGGRGFGFTGGHYHWNWGDPNFRKVVLNAIVWTAHGEVPKGGVSDKPVTLEQLEENQDYDPPNKFDREEVRERLNLPISANGRRTNRQKVLPVFRSPVVTSKTPGHAVEIKADIRGADELYLVVDDGGNGYGCDWADWAEPRLIGPKGEKKLTELKWASAVTDFGEVRINANVQNQPLRIDGKEVSYGIGTHANSTIAYKIPKGYTEFRARGGLDNGGTEQSACGSAASVRFAVYTKNPGRVGSGAVPASNVDRSPAGAVDGLDVAEGLEATVFAAEPKVLSLTNLDIDHRGRVWVCEVINYRRHNGKREAGDRILILEDTDQDGVADTSKVFYQGRDIDSAMGICVLGNKVIVSASPHVWVFTDIDGDDKADEKELLFSNTGQPQHDHSAHSFLFGPDGKLYWNFGNTGKAVHDANGKPIKDIYGRTVVDNGKPFYGGMAFRCNLDGSEFEVLGHNFRNNYEVTVDSYGNIWQSDNDDDGNRGVRINFVVEHGNYGYKDQITGAGWRTERTGMHEEIPLRHWHLRDPGVMPNLLQTGAGSPTGITIYEGRLLPKRFWDQVIHCDAGPNIVRAYPVEQTGAGYAAREEMVLEGTRDKWFRPADVCVGPDGSLFVTDWYDPGVGGHNMQDLDRGRLFRIAPPNSPYKFVKADFSTVEGAIRALGSPNAATRYLAWQALHKMDGKAEEALVATLRDAENPRIKARALWLLTKSSNGAKHIGAALAHQDENLRIVALRAARQTDFSVDDAASQLARDKSPAVRREVAVALHQVTRAKVPSIWATLAEQYSGGDRWYLESLGLAADGNWDACLTTLAKSKVAPEIWNDILWRSRGSSTGIELAELIAASQNSQEVARYFRALDFQDGRAREQAATAVLQAELNGNVRDFARVESLKRLPAGKLVGDDQLRERVADSLSAMPKDSQFVALVDRFSLEELYPSLIELVVNHPNETAGADAARTLLRKKQGDQLTALARSHEAEKAAATMTALGNTGDPAALAILKPIMNDKKADSPSRRVAAKCVAKIPAGAQQLLQSQQDGKLEQILQTAVAFDLNRSSVPKIRERAAKLFPLPVTKNAALPPIDQLLKRRGNAVIGSKLFGTTAECAKCHIVGKEGKDLGPNLTEIGSKLSREALFESILFPSAGISHNYEGYIVETEGGLILSGILISKTADKVVLKTVEGIQREIAVDEIAEMAKLPISLMPADIQKTMTTENLIDVIEYLQTLKKK
jgi:putative membrane-bound dehydrogenase-like protein